MFISVVIPVYNVAPYLRRCVDSILQQSYTAYQIVLVDDGSTDGSGHICDEYASISRLIKVIHKKNGGLSEARNVGVEESDGEYITFIDSDDAVSKDYLLTLSTIIKKYGVDMACACFSFVSNDTMPKEDCSEYDVYICNGVDACKELLYEENFYTSSCNSLIARRIVQDNPFPVGKFHEDEFTTFRYMIASNRVAFTQKKLYYYFQRMDSISHLDGKQVIDELKSAYNYVEICGNISVAMKRAAMYKKYCMLRRVMIKHPELKQFAPEEYYSALKYIDDNWFRCQIYKMFRRLVVIGKKIVGIKR